MATIKDFLTFVTVDASKVKNQRTGQILFNHLPPAVANVVLGQIWDPFYKDLNHYEIAEWIDNHLIFDGNKIVAVFDGEHILWEA